MVFSSRRILIVLSALLFTSLLCWWRIRLLGDVRQQLGAFYGWFTLAFIVYLATLWVVHRVTHAQPTGRWTSWWAMALVLIGAVAFRALLIGSPPTLSDDIYRYRWDGRVQRAGINPYTYPPNAPALAFLRDDHSNTINFPHLRTIYPPLTQFAVRLGASMAETLTAQKVVFVSAELLVVASLLFILWRRRLSLLWIAAYLWHPLVILEIAGSGHNDTLGLAMLWIGFAAWEARWWLGASLGWAAAFLAKFASALLVPWWWMRKARRRWLGVSLLVSSLPFLLNPAAVTALRDSLGAMAGRFGSNASLYLVAVWLTRSVPLARLSVFVLGAGFLLWWARRQEDPIRYWVGAVTAVAFLSPVLHPWYLVWLIPCFCFVRVPSLLVLTGTIVLAYTVWPGRLLDGRWQIPIWAHVLEYVPAIALGGWELWRLQRCRWLGSSSRLATKPRLFLES